MAGAKEIKTRMKSVAETEKITNAMYLMSSTKVRKAKSELAKTKPYFDAIAAEIKRIFKTVDRFESKYFYPEDGFAGDAPYGYLAITADKGLAGAYNHNIIKQVERAVTEHDNSRLYVIGDYGREYFRAHGRAFEEDFTFSAQRPTLSRSRKIARELLSAFDRGEFSKLFVVYTDVTPGAEPEVRTARILPFHSSEFAGEKEKRVAFEFSPSPEAVLQNIVPSYVAGFIYSALVDSFCAEQNARMNAMKSADDNARSMLDGLRREYNHVRQSVITREITEIASGAKYRRKDNQE